MSAAMVSRFQSELLRAIDGRTNVSVNASTTFTTLEFTSNLLAYMLGSIAWPAEIVAHVATYETVTGTSVDEMHRIANTIQQGPINISTSNSTWYLSISAHGNASYRIADHRATMAANGGDAGVSTGLTVGLVVVAFVCILTVGSLVTGRVTQAGAKKKGLATPVYEASLRRGPQCLESMGNRWGDAVFTALEGGTLDRHLFPRWQPGCELTSSDDEEDKVTKGQYLELASSTAADEDSSETTTDVLIVQRDDAQPEQAGM